MGISRLYATLRPVFSFEFFPPKTDAGYRALYCVIGELKELAPGFVSVTSHARGENRSKTAELVIRIQNELGITAMAHMTCTGSQTREELAETLAQLARGGIENVMALREKGTILPGRPSKTVLKAESIEFHCFAWKQSASIANFFLMPLTGRQYRLWPLSVPSTIAVIKWAVT